MPITSEAREGWLPEETKVKKPKRKPYTGLMSEKARGTLPESENEDETQDLIVVDSVTSY